MDLITVGIEESTEVDDVAVLDKSHDLQLSVLPTTWRSISTLYYIFWPIYCIGA
jgi:hypothetical protein